MKVVNSFGIKIDCLLESYECGWIPRCTATPIKCFRRIEDTDITRDYRSFLPRCNDCKRLGKMGFTMKKCKEK